MFSDPRDYARARAHARAGCDAATIDECTCQAAPEDMAAVWRGRARMARARRIAGATLDAYDRQALDRYPGDTP